MNPHPALSHPMGEGEAIWGDWITQGCARSSLHPGLPSCHPYGISVWLNFNSSNMKPRRTGNTDGMNPHPGPLPSDGRGRRNLGRPVYPGLRSLLSTPWATIMSSLREFSLARCARVSHLLSAGAGQARRNATAAHPRRWLKQVWATMARYSAG